MIKSADVNRSGVEDSTRIDRISDTIEVNALRTEILQALEFVHGLKYRSLDSDLGLEKPYVLNDADITRINLVTRLLAKLWQNLVELDDLKLDLRFSQVRAIEHLKNFLFNLGDEGALRGYFQQPPGAGKTILFGLIVKMLDVPTVIFVPTRVIMEQVREELISKLGISEDKIGVINKDEKIYDRKITLVTYSGHVQSSKNSKAYNDVLEGAELLIGDEMHKSLGPQTLAFIESQHKGAKLWLGFTATSALVNKQVDQYMPLISSVAWGEMVKTGVLLPLKVWQVEAVLEESDVKNSIITEAEEVAVLEKQAVYKKLLDRYKEAQEKFKEREFRACVFCATNLEAEKFLNLAKTRGYNSAIVTGKHNEIEVKEAEKRMMLPMGDPEKLNFIITVNKLAEGWDFPALNTVLLARATGSPAKLLQSVGRAFRAYEGEEWALVLEPNWYFSGRRKNHISNELVLFESEDGSEDGAEEEASEVKEGIDKGPTRRKQRLVPALTVAGSLTQLGETPDDVIINLEDVNFMRYLPLSDKWILEIHERQKSGAVIINKMVPLRDKDYRRFQDLTYREYLSRRDSLVPFQFYKGIAGSKVVDLYAYEEVVKVMGGALLVAPLAKERRKMSFEERLKMHGIKNSRDLLATPSGRFRKMNFATPGNIGKLSGAKMIKDFLGLKERRTTVYYADILKVYKKLVEEHGWEKLSKEEEAEIYEKKILTYYREALYKTGIEYALDLYLVDTRSLKFEDYEGWRSFLKDVYKMPKDSLSVVERTDLANLLGVPKLTREVAEARVESVSKRSYLKGRSEWGELMNEVLFEFEKPEYLRLLADCEITDYESLISMSHDNLKILSFGRFGKWKGFVARVVGRVSNEASPQSLVGVLAKKLGWLESLDLFKKDRNLKRRYLIASPSGKVLMNEEGYLRQLNTIGVSFADQLINYDPGKFSRVKFVFRNSENITQQMSALAWIGLVLERPVDSISGVILSELAQKLSLEERDLSQELQEAEQRFENLLVLLKVAAKNNGFLYKEDLLNYGIEPFRRLKWDVNGENIGTRIFATKLLRRNVLSVNKQVLLDCVLALELPFLPGELKKERELQKQQNKERERVRMLPVLRRALRGHGIVSKQDLLTYSVFNFRKLKFEVGAKKPVGIRRFVDFVLGICPKSVTRATMQEMAEALGLE